MLRHACGYALANKGMESLALEFEFGILPPFCSSFLWTPNFEVPTRYFVGTFFSRRLGLRLLGVTHTRVFVRYWQLQHGGLLAFFQKR